MSLNDLFSNIATAIRAKSGSSATIKAVNFPAAIASLPSGGNSKLISDVKIVQGATVAESSCTVDTLYKNFILFVAPTGASGVNFNLQGSCATIYIPDSSVGYSWVYFNNKWRVVDSSSFLSVSGNTINFYSSEALFSKDFSYYLYTWE